VKKNLKRLRCRACARPLRIGWIYLSCACSITRPQWYWRQDKVHDHSVITLRRESHD